jgi:RecA/RadA recombinase
MPPKTDAFLAKLKAFCDLEYGRRSQLARELGVSRQTITDMLNWRRNPTSEQLLEIIEWLERERK